MDGADEYWITRRRTARTVNKFAREHADHD